METAFVCNCFLFGSFGREFEVKPVCTNIKLLDDLSSAERNYSLILRLQGHVNMGVLDENSE
jgi:hypothetical protein